MTTDHFDIALLGWGIRGLGQLTLEQYSLLRRARHVVSSRVDQPELTSLLRRGTKRHEVFGNIYAEGRSRLQIYREVADLVVELGARDGRTVYLQYGHPMIYSRPTEFIRRDARRLGLRVQCFSGISFVDEILTRLGLDFRARDLQIFHATHLFEQRKRINPGVDLLLPQIGLVGERAACLDPTTRQNRDVSAYRRLRDRLLDFYPPTQRLTLIYLDVRGPEYDELRSIRLAKLVEAAPGLHSGHTGYIRGRPR